MKRLATLALLVTSLTLLAGCGSFLATMQTTP